MKRSILTNGIQFFLKPDGGEGGGGNSDHLHEQAHETDGDKKAHVPTDEGFKTFNERFSAKNRAPVTEGGDIKNKPNQEEIDQRIKDNERIAAERSAEKAKNQDIGRRIEENKRPGSNVPKIVEDKRKAEQERDEIKARLEKYETEEKPAIEKKIADLQAQIDKGVSSKKEEELTGKITELETKMQEREDTLVNENQSLRQRLAFYNLQEDDDFKEKFVAPVQKAFAEASDVLTTDRQRAALRTALAINGQILRAGDRDERAKLMGERDEALNAIAQDLQGFSSQRFTSAITQYLQAAQDHAKAMQDHEKTTQEIRAEAQKRADRARADRLATWDKTFKVTKQQYDSETQLSEADKKLAKELGIDPEAELKKADAIASATVLGKSTMTDAIDMIHKGRVYSVQKARIQILERQLADRDAVITKLRGAGTEGGNKNSEGSGSGEKKATQKPTREEWQSKFGANRASA